MNESNYIYEWVMSHIWMSHVTHMDESCHICLILERGMWAVSEAIMTHLCVWHDPSICVTWPIYKCDMTHLYVWHDPSICVTWPHHTCDMAHSCVRHRAACHIYILVISHTWMGHVNASCHIYMWVISHTWHGPFMCVPSRMHVCDMTHICMWHDAFMHVPYESFICVIWLIHMCDMTHS